MQPQFSPAPEPYRQPSPTVQPAKERRKGLPGWAWMLLLLALIAGGWLAWRQLGQQLKPGGPAGIQAVRTAVAKAGEVQRTLRLTGTTSAERFASLTVPQLRGMRGGGAPVIGAQSGSGSTSQSGSSGTASASASSGTTSTFRAVTNRFGASSSSKTSSSTSAASSSSSSSSASGGGGGDMGMSGGSNDFMQVLQTVKPAGTVVRKGETVAEFDRQYQLMRLDDYQASVDQSERTLKSLDADLDVQRKAFQQSLDQAKAAVEKADLDVKTIPVRSDIDAENLRLKLEEARANLKQLQGQAPHEDVTLKSQRRISEIGVEQTRVELRRADRNVQTMVLKAPMDGMLVMENMMRGSEFSQIQQGDQLFPGQMFARVVDPSSMVVTASVNQADVEFVRVGSKAELRFDAFPGLVLPAHVVSIGAITKPGGMRSNFVKEIPVFLKLDKMDPRVIPDLSVSVDVVVGSQQDQVLVPLEAVFRDSPGGKPYVFVKTAAGFEKREVELGLCNNITAAVTVGLKKGEEIALERPSAQPGQGDSTGERNVQRS